MRKRLSLLISAGLLLGLTGVAQAGESGLVRTDSGPVRGTVLADHRRYQAIPYAAPPVGELRWTITADRPAVDGRPRRHPTERRLRPGAGAGAASTTEDCLYLNVTTPGHRRRKPVMVWIHGGGIQLRVRRVVRRAAGSRCRATSSW